MSMGAQSVCGRRQCVMGDVLSELRRVLLLVVALMLNATGASAEEAKAGFEVTLGERVSPVVLPGPIADIETITGPTSSLKGAQFFELSPYRQAKVKWVEGTSVEVRLYGEMRLRKVKQQAVREAAIKAGDDGVTGKGFFIADCGLLPSTEQSWVFDPGDLLCEGDFVDGSAVIEVRVKATPPAADRAIYFRAKNRRFPFVGSDLGVALSLTQPLQAEGDLDKGFEINDGLSLYYSISRLKSDRWRAIASLAALDHVKPAAGETEDPEDLEIGLGLGMMFKSNGFLDTNTGMSLAAGIGYNFMVPESSERWYWFFGVGANFGRTGARDD